MSLKHNTIEELQQLGNNGDEAALLELGRKVLDVDFCLVEKHYMNRDRVCTHLNELVKLQSDLDTDIPPDCPHCGKWITDH